MEEWREFVKAVEILISEDEEVMNLNKTEFLEILKDYLKKIFLRAKLMIY